MKIIIKKSPTADTRTCDWSKVEKETLLESSYQHISDVRQGMRYLASRLVIASDYHDFTKIEQIDQFHEDFKTGFSQTIWWDNHKKQERHHLSITGKEPKDVDLIDVIEYLVDGVMAGLARSGEYRKEEIPSGLLERAFDNTVKKLVKEIKVV